MKELINHKILDVEIGAQENLIRFTTETDIFVYVAYGDCCSESWFSEIINLDFLINSVVINVEELELPEYNQIDGNSRQDSDVFYGFSIITKNGHTTIVFRNSSNGYYGGSCSLVSDYKENDIDNFKSIKHIADWTAYELTNTSYFHTLKLKAFL